MLCMRLLSSDSDRDLRKWSKRNMLSLRIFSLTMEMLREPRRQTDWARNLSASMEKSLERNLVQTVGLNSISQQRYAFHSSNSSWILRLVILSSPFWICFRMRSFSLSSSIRSQNISPYLCTTPTGLLTISAISSQLRRPNFSQPVTKLLKSPLFQSRQPVASRSSLSRAYQAVSGGQLQSQRLLLWSSSFCSSSCSTSRLLQKWCSATTTRLSVLASRLPCLPSAQLGPLSFSRRVRKSACSSLASISSMASASSRLRFSSACMKSKMLMLFMLKSVRLACWALSLSSTSRDSSLVLLSPRASTSSICSSVMVPLLALKMMLAPYCSISFISSLVRALFFWEFFCCCWITRLSHFSFIICRSTIFSSTVFSVISRYTFTILVCPILCARSIACRSICGLKSLSYITTVSAAVRFIPRPPARVDSRNTNRSESSRMKELICSSRESMSVEPSMRQQEKRRQLQQSSRMSSTMVIWEKMSTLWPPSLASLNSSRSRMVSLPLVSMRWSPMLGASSGSMLGKRQGWLHTFRSCISRFRQCFFSSYEAFLFCSRFWQILSWVSVSPTQMQISFLGGRLVSTSRLVRRSMNGFRILCSLPIISAFFFSTSCSDSWSPPPSTLANQLSNSSLLVNIQGRRKLSSDHSSWRLFWRGVPVSSSLHSVCSRRTTCDSWLASFLILCASSMTMQCHFIFLRLGRHSRTPSKEVTRMSNLPLSTTLARISSRSSLVAMSLVTRAQGSHFSNSFIQLPRVILGAMTMCGPLTFLNSLMKERIEMVWMVLPRPMSSARMPLIPLSQRLIIQLSPTSWQYFSSPPLRMLGCTSSRVNIPSCPSSSSIRSSISRLSPSQWPLRFRMCDSSCRFWFSCRDSRKLVQNSACFTSDSTASSGVALGAGFSALSCSKTACFRLLRVALSCWGGLSCSMYKIMIDAGNQQGISITHSVTIPFGISQLIRPSSFGPPDRPIHSSSSWIAPRSPSRQKRSLMTSALSWNKSSEHTATSPNSNSTYSL